MLDYNNDDWDVINKEKNIMKYNKEITNIEYNITDQIINNANQRDDIVTESNTDDYHIYKFYKIYDNDQNSDYFYSRTSIETTMMNDIINYNKGQKKLMIFTKLTDIKYKLLECYKVNKDVNVRKELDEIKDKLRNNNNNINKHKHKHKDKDKDIISQDTIIQKYKKYINDNIDKTNNKTRYYIYKLTDHGNQSQIYIYGSYNKIKKNEIDELIIKQCIAFDTKKIKVEIIKELDINSELEGLIVVDEEIKKHDSINNGLNNRMNRYYNILDVNNYNEQKIFMMIQQDKLNKLKLTDNKINSGFIASINIKDYKYIYSDIDNSKYNKLNIFYNMTQHNETKYDRIINLLKTTKFEDIKIELLEINIDKDILEFKLIKHLNYYDKAKLLNYHDDYYAKPEDIKKLSGLIYSYKFSKFSKNT